MQYLGHDVPTRESIQRVAGAVAQVRGTGEREAAHLRQPTNLARTQSRHLQQPGMLLQKVSIETRPRDSRV